MAFAGSRHINASHSVFADISDVHTVNINANNSNDLLKSDDVKGPLYLPMPSYNKLFTGHDDYLEKLRQHFCPRDTCVPSRSCLVHGIGGAGKTQICLRLVEEISKQFWRVFWVDATTDETIELSLRDIAADPDAQAAGVARSSTSVLQWLSMVKHDWLIVFDNVIDAGVAKFLPRGNRGNILFTSRNPTLSRLASAGNCIEVDSMASEDAISLLLRSSGTDVSSTQARQVAGPIVKELFCLPLAVDQAGAAIASGLCAMDDYLWVYRHHRQKLSADPFFEGASGYGRAVYGTWDLSFTDIEKKGTPEAECAIFILRTFAFFHHETISEEIVKRAAESSRKRPNNLPPHLLQLDESGNWDPIFFRGGIRILLSFSLIKSTAVFGVHSLHPLVHCWSRDRMSSDEQQTSSCSAFTLLSSSIEFCYMADDFRYRRTLIPHIKALKLASRLTYDGERYSQFALALGEAGHWKEAEELETEVMETSLKVLGEEDLFTLTSMGALASTYRNQGRLKDAEKLEVQVMERRKRVLDEEHPDTLTSMGNLALTYRSQGQWKDAEKLQVQVMETSLRVLGEEHSYTLTSMGNLASTYRSQKQWKDAEKLEVQVMKSRKRLLGEEHPHTLASIANLASTYCDQGRWKDAEQLEVEVMESRKKVLGKEHPDTLTAMGNLASTYWNQGRWKDAEKLEVEVIESRKEVLGKEHPDTLTTMGNLALTYRNQGRWKDAEELQVQVTESSLRVLGGEHPHTLMNMEDLASTYKNQGQWKDAEKLRVQVMETSLRVLGEGHPNTLMSMANLASTYLDQGRWKDAEKLEVQVMESRKKVLGEEHPDTLTSIESLALIYWNQGWCKYAEKLEVQVLESRKKVLGKEHPDTLTTMGNLASMYWDQGRRNEAEKLDVQVMELRKKGLGEERPDTLVSARTLASRHRNQAQRNDPEVPGMPVVSAEMPSDDVGVELDPQPRCRIVTLSRMFKPFRDLFKSCLSVFRR